MEIDNFEFNESRDKVGVISFIGLANAGKSTLVNSLVGKKVSIVSNKEQTTRQRVMGIRTDVDSQLVFIDNPGFFTRKNNGQMAHFLKNEIAEGVEGVDYIGVVVDAAEFLKDAGSISQLFSNLKKMQSIHGQTLEKTPDSIIINKIDKIEKIKILPLIKLLSEHVNSLYSSKNIEYIPISAKTGEGIKELFEHLKSKCEKGPLMFPKDILTPQSDELFASEIIREKAFINLKQELPYGVAVICRSWESSEQYETIFADIIVEKDSHKGIVVGKGGSMLQEIGTSARKELERIYGSKFVLKLFVRIEEDWTRSISGLRKTGYDNNRLVSNDSD
jgi:GTP-binding protein Era